MKLVSDKPTFFFSFYLVATRSLISAAMENDMVFSAKSKKNMHCFSETFTHKNGTNPYASEFEKRRDRRGAHARAHALTNRLRVGSLYNVYTQFL